MRLYGWIGLTALSLLLPACGGDSQANIETGGCVPACRAGFTCVGGSCVSACNPPCASRESCSVIGGAAVCLGLDGGAPVTDAGAVATDLGVGADVPAGPVDVPPAATDAAGCGHPGEACCDLRYCAMGAECLATVMDSRIVAGTCRTAVPGVRECARPADCTTAGEVCGGPIQSGEHLCFQCGRPTGTLPMGSACTGSAMCASGLCALRQCSSPCATDADCAALLPGAVCTAVRYTNTLSTTQSVLVTRTVCVRGCSRNADCTGGQVCHPALNRVTDHTDFICQDPSPMTAPAGTPCSSGETCQSSLCPPPLAAGRASACTAPCVLDADCPAAAPRCAEYAVARPSGAVQLARGCFPNG